MLVFMVLVGEGKQVQLILNAGGPDRVSRAQIAETVADVRGYSTSLIKSVSASSVSGLIAKNPIKYLLCYRLKLILLWLYI